MDITISSKLLFLYGMETRIYTIDIIFNNNELLYSNWNGKGQANRRKYLYLSLLLPMDISFYIFPILSYIIDVYRGRTKAEKHFEIFDLYVIFFI